MSDHLIAEANRHARSLIIERDQLRAEVQRLKHGTVAQFKDAFIDELKRENTELRVSCDEHAKGYVETRKRIAALESEIDRLHAINAVRESAIARAERAEAELAKERARLRQLALDACRAAAIVPVVWYPTGYYVNPNDLGKINKQQVDACVAAIDAAMKEGAK